MDIKQIEINGEVFPVEDSEARNSITAMNTTIAEQAQTIAQLQKIGTVLKEIGISVGNVRSANFAYTQIGKIVFFRIYLNLDLPSPANSMEILPPGSIPPADTSSHIGTPVFDFVANYPTTNPPNCRIIINKDGSVQMTINQTTVSVIGNGFYFTN